MNIVGIDPSTRTGVAVLSPEGTVLSTKVITFPKERGHRRLQLIAQGIRTVLDDAGDSPTVIIEGYAYNNPHSLVTLVEVGTLIRHTLFLRGLEWIEVQPTVLKKFTTGRGAAPRGTNTKDFMAQHVKDRWGFESKSNDVVDAYALARFGCELTAGTNQHPFTRSN